MTDEVSPPFRNDRYGQAGRGDAPGASVAGRFFYAYAATKSLQPMRRGALTPRQDQWLTSHEAMLARSVEAVRKIDPEAGELMREYVGDDDAVNARIAYIEAMPTKLGSEFKVTAMHEFASALETFVGEEAFRQLPQPTGQPRPDPRQVGPDDDFDR